MVKVLVESFHYFLVTGAFPRRFARSLKLVVRVKEFEITQKDLTDYLYKPTIRKTRSSRQVILMCQFVCGGSEFWFLDRGTCLWMSAIVRWRGKWNSTFYAKKCKLDEADVDHNQSNPVYQLNYLLQLFKYGAKDSCCQSKRMWKDNCVKIIS
jgi:hypothetical protein